MGINIRISITPESSAPDQNIVLNAIRHFIDDYNLTELDPNGIPVPVCSPTGQVGNSPLVYCTGNSLFEIIGALDPGPNGNTLDNFKDKFASYLQRHSTDSLELDFSQFYE